MPSAYSSANPKADAPGPPPRADASSASLLRLKSELLDLVYGTCRGVAASATQRAAVDKLVCALEARNPHPATTDVSRDLGDGGWRTGRAGSGDRSGLHGGTAGATGC